METMCNDYEQHILYAEYCKMMQDLDLAISDHQGEADCLEPMTSELASRAQSCGQTSTGSNSRK